MLGACNSRAWHPRRRTYAWGVPWEPEMWPTSTAWRSTGRSDAPAQQRVPAQEDPGRRQSEHPLSAGSFLATRNRVWRLPGLRSGPRQLATVAAPSPQTPYVPSPIPPQQGHWPSRGNIQVWCTSDCTSGGHVGPGSRARPPTRASSSGRRPRPQRSPRPRCRVAPPGQPPTVGHPHRISSEVTRLGGFRPAGSERVVAGRSCSRCRRRQRRAYGRCRGGCPGVSDDSAPRRMSRRSAACGARRT